MASSRKNPDLQLIQLCDDFAEAVRVRDQLLVTAERPRYDCPDVVAAGNRARSILDKILTLQAFTESGRQAQIRALQAIQRDETRFDQLIKTAPDWFGALSALVLRDQMLSANPVHSEDKLDAPMCGQSPYKIGQRRLAAFQSISAYQQAGFRINKQKPDAQGAYFDNKRKIEIAQDMASMLGDTLALGTSCTIADAAVQLAFAYELLWATAGEEEETEAMRQVRYMVASVLPVICKASERPLDAAIEDRVLQSAEESRAAFQAILPNAPVSFHHTDTP